jgi:hypothetical protein
MSAEKKTKSIHPKAQAALEALKAAAKAARKIAKMYGTPIFVERDGKVIALKP